ncbi:MAG TPA: O-antigen ligase family protein [Cyclobacteriaceae bacterium]|jgi:putative inorganic carbon (HCO3(-)) transporter|nr:O-antigen ligase family protein [Cyclobacteriaceae bacterium]HRE68776.1 O-antigen ligase family protein [Cyclobacteriaceae bacterium]HRF33582.1 O-antigen ligase family protein [Cyclobacteriaceae bacterium]
MRAKFTGVGLKESWLLLVLLALVSIGIAFAVAKINFLIGPIIIVLLIGLALASYIFTDYRVGFYGGLILASIMFYFERLIPVSLPYGVLCDLAFLLAFIVLLFNPKYTHWKQYLTHPITIGYIITFLFQIFQAFNPNAVSLTAWLVSLRGLLLMLIMIVSLELASKAENIKLLFKIWMLIALAAALYGIYQEFIGLPGFEMRWLTADPLRYRLIVIFGNIRKFSFLSDPSSFGVFMAASALGAFAMGFAPVSLAKKLILFGGAFVMSLSMLYSGTRTAYAMLAAGIVLFILLTIRKKATFITAFLLVLGFLAIMFGPFYNPTINRFRSAFKPSTDASMEVRDVKRIDWQPLIRSHPMGYGINTSGATGARYAPGQWLAGWDTDSGYLKVGIEQGWIGLTILMVFLGMVMIYGIGNHFALNSPMLQSLNLAFLVSFFSVTVAAFTQHALLYKPVYILVISTYSVVICIRNLDKPNPI